jgi:hypothetical protein
MAAGAACRSNWTYSLNAFLESESADRHMRVDTHCELQLEEVLNNSAMSDIKAARHEIVRK